MGLESSALITILPMKDRKPGIIFDGKVTNTVMVNNYESYDMTELKVPVLIIHAEDDKLAGNLDTIHKWAELIPDCKALFLKDGGHMMIGNSLEIDKTVDEFIAENK